MSIIGRTTRCDTRLRLSTSYFTLLVATRFKKDVTVPSDPKLDANYRIKTFENINNDDNLIFDELVYRLNHQACSLPRCLTF